MPYTLEPDGLMPAYKVLTKDLLPLNCPYHAPIISQNKFRPGEVSLQYKGCGTWCALFIQRNDIVLQTCGNNSTGIKLEEGKKETSLKLT